MMRTMLARSRDLACMCVVLSSLVGCSRAQDPDEGVQTRSSCIEGQLGCACDPAGRCDEASTGSGPVVCMTGWCVPDPTTCPLGQEGCACAVRGLCSDNEGVRMTCNGGMCEPSVIIARGMLGGSCNKSRQCDGDLVCDQGRCEIAGCVPKLTGCSCGKYGECGDASRCVEGRCEAVSCVVGASGCTCQGSHACAPGYMCIQGTCAKARVALTVSDERARACDVVLLDPNRVIDASEVAAATRRSFKRRDHHIAISIHRTDDNAFERDSIVFISSTHPTPQQAGVQILSASCYDALGQALDAVEVSFVTL